MEAEEEWRGLRELEGIPMCCIKDTRLRVELLQRGGFGLAAPELDLHLRTWVPSVVSAACQSPTQKSESTMPERLKGSLCVWDLAKHMEASLDSCSSKGKRIPGPVTSYDHGTLC